MRGIKPALTTREAKRVAEKELEGFIFKDEKIVDAILHYVPLYVARCLALRYASVPFLSRKVEKRENLYLNALNGNLLYYYKGKTYFSSLIEKDAFDIKDIDNITIEFTEIEHVIPPKLRHGDIITKVESMFGIAVESTDMLAYPIWEFVAVDRDVGLKRKIFVDAVTGNLVEGYPL